MQGMSVTTRTASKKPAVARAYGFVLILCVLFLAAFTTSCSTLSTAQAPMLPQASGRPYDAAISGSGQAPYVLALQSGTLPPGPHLNPQTGLTTGTPSSAGTFNVSVAVEDAQHTNVVFRPISVSVSPNSATVSSGGAQQFGATVRNSSNVGVTWAASAGSISANGLFTAPAVSTNTNVTVTATSVADSSKYSSAAILVTPAVVTPPVSVSISPTSATVASSGTQQFAATVRNTSNTRVTWWASAGNISLSGLFTAPNASSNTTVIVTAISLADSSKQATATITVNPATTPLAVRTSTLPDATAGTAYQAALTATGGEAPYQWSITSGVLPQGIQLDASTGALSGTTSASGSFSFNVTATDAALHTASHQLTLVAVAITGGPAVPSTFFGLQSKPVGGTYPTVNFGASRLWDRQVQWSTLNPASGVYSWTNVDAILGQLKIHGMGDEITYTFGAVPNWASSAPSDTACDLYTVGGCDLPTDLNSDGTGTNATFIAFVQNLARHVNDPTYLQTHAHVRYWETWNEWYRDPVLSPYNQGCIARQTCSIRATYAQMVRLTEDLRCVITGTGSVNGAPCTRTPIDPTAKILTPSAHGRSRFGVAVMENFLHCDARPAPSSQCITGDRGRNAIDVLNFHFYTMLSETAEEVTEHMANIKAGLRSADLNALPVWSDEGGWGLNTSLTDPDQQEAYVVRYFLLGWSSGLSRMMWYEFENNSWGTLYAPRKNGALTKAGLAYQQVYDWMAGNVMSQSCSGPAYPNQGVWTCSLTKPDGSRMLAVWDSSQTCSGGTCTTSQYSQGSGYTSYLKMDTAKPAALTKSTVLIGAKPILLLQ